MYGLYVFPTPAYSLTSDTCDYVAGSYTLITAAQTFKSTDAFAFICEPCTDLLIAAAATLNYIHALWFVRFANPMAQLNCQLS